MTDINCLSCNSAAFTGLSADILQRGKSLRFRAHGISMYPLVHDGDLLLVEPAEGRPIRISDIVLCSSQAGCIVVHRVLHRRNGKNGVEFLVQGDQAGRPDGWIPQAQVYGRLAILQRDGMQIDMGRPLSRILGWLALLRSYWHQVRRECLNFARRLPIFYRYQV